MALTGRQKKYAKFCLNEKTRMFVNHRSITGHHNKSYDYENNNKYMQKPKIQYRSPRKCQSHLNQTRFSELFIYDSLDVVL